MASLQVLVIEDDPVAAQFLREAIAQAGHAVRHAADAAGGLALASTTRFDFVITDLRLPDMSGEEILATLRASGCASAHTPVVAISGELGPQRRRSLLDAGFHAAWEKPLRLGQLHSLFPITHGSAHQPARAATKTTISGATADAEFDDDGALAACGSIDVLHGLRSLFAAELPAQLTRLRDAVVNDDRAAIDSIAHTLRGGCRFCGATGLQHALDILQRAANAGARSRALRQIDELAERARVRFDTPR